NGALPIAVPEPAPRHVRAYFIDESNGNTIGSSDLTAGGLDANGNQLWDNSANPTQLSPTTTQDQVGVRVALSGATSTTCGDPLVTCYPSDTTSTLNYVHGYSGATPSSAAAQPNKRMVRAVTLSSTSCNDASISN